MGALARERIGGLQKISEWPPKPRAKILGYRWERACGDLRRFLARNQISFEWITPDASDLEAKWRTKWGLDEPLRQSVFLSGLAALDDRRFEFAADRFGLGVGKIGIHRRAQRVRNLGCIGFERAKARFHLVLEMVSRLQAGVRIPVLLILAAELFGFGANFTRT